jgi:uncharacterized membrane protein YcaP (DUF421 family)
MDAIARFFDVTLGLSAHQAQDLGTAQTCARAVVVYLLLIGYVRFGKKRFLGRATAFDAIRVIVIGSLASRAVSGTAPFVATLAATYVFVLFHWIISYFAKDSKSLSALVKGHDSILVQDGQVRRQALEEAHMSSDDLLEDLRGQGVEGPDAVKQARLERSGTVSVIRK